MTIKYGSKELERDFGPLTVGDLLFLERDDLELTQVEMAKKLGISRQRLCDFEKGRRLPSAKALVAWKLNDYTNETMWLDHLLEDQLRRDGLNYEVRVKLKTD